MVASPYCLSGPPRHIDQKVVVQQGANEQGLSEITIMSGGTFERSFWTRVLKEKGLESPGRDEALRRTMEKVACRKELEEARRAAKVKKGKGRK